mmetsp:Transcript_39151/g.58186  ORF Transcript_39151/g.58186 Transcript_39151/m.58186 type:complete len:184 (-) Transcript_39151:253-804(-)|eukprot:CAMPEP_0194043780 /NCGR_PEP_ID=MMETSP0009_2-20130614/15357_1 /TAXON_ID=210454 /ORGANISM="Grammatophora oceanica, Strain CCMP 410" /LENGTH=183 /DNA_ID=CAMNT_0038688113 /DNA_START=181 /DNA_END=732 /DNA_ORIENTATION=-
MSDEPEAKKAKPTGWEDHKLNISEAVMKADEGRFLTDIAKDPIRTLQGIGPKADSVLKEMNLKTIEDLATYKYFLMSRALVTLSETEVAGDRPTTSTMNVDKAVDKDMEAKSLKDICAAPTEALEGLAEKARVLLEELGVKTVGDLANFKYCRWAEAIIEAAKYEETKTKQERKTAAALAKLS